MKHNHYTRLMVMTALSFISMYVLMYAMVDSASSVFNNFNQVYMAGLMTAPMVVIELLLMRAMYENKKLNIVVIAGAVAAGLVLFTMIRQQTAISDRQFLRSMIPHHSGAILMCRQASLQDPEIWKLCEAIVSSQQHEIDFMTGKLRQLH